jgi:tRNA-specific 2-thiouridylase
MVDEAHRPVGSLDGSFARAGVRSERVSGRASSPARALVQVRYRHPGAPARLEIRSRAELRVHFEHPVRAVAPGQAAVFYDGDLVLGGGWIARPIP